jgi:Fic family protein
MEYNWGMKREDFTNPSGELTEKYGELSFIPEPLPPKWTISGETLKICTSAGLSLGQLNGALLGQKINPWLLMVPFFREEAVASSSIEGIETGLPTLFPIEEIQIKKGKLSEKELNSQQVSNHYNAIMEGAKLLKDLPLAGRVVKTLHRILLSNLPVVGEFRRIPNRVRNRITGEIIYVPPPVPEMERGITNWEQYINDDAPHPLIQCALQHYQFEALHPFLDGNGRVGRMLISLFLVKRGLLVHPALHMGSLFERHREKYYACLLAVNRCSAWEEWINFFISGVDIQARVAHNRIMDLNAWADSRKAGFSKSKRWQRLKDLIDLLTAYPILSRPLIRKELRFSDPTVKSLVEFLVKEKVLEVIEGKKHPYSYRCNDVLEIFAKKPP